MGQRRSDRHLCPVPLISSSGYCCLAWCSRFLKVVYNSSFPSMHRNARLLCLHEKVLCFINHNHIGLEGSMPNNMSINSMSMHCSGLKMNINMACQFQTPYSGGASPSALPCTKLSSTSTCTEPHTAMLNLHYDYQQNFS
jgi:hypothetical protein